MAKSKIIKGAENRYKKIEDTVVNTYKKVENAVVGTYEKVEDAFIDKYLTRDGETIEEAKQRLKSDYNH